MRNELENQNLCRGVSISQSQPSVGQKVIDFGSLRRWKSCQNVFHVFEGIDLEAFAGFDYAHDGGSRFTAVLGASEEPIASTQNQWLNAALAGVVADVN